MLTAVSIRSEDDKHGQRVNVLEQAYVDYFAKLGLQLIVIPNSGRVDEYFKNLNIVRIILTGGNDVDPQTYGSKRLPNQVLVPGRDETEKRLIAISLQKNIPLLAICRGMQFVNVNFGGELVGLEEYLESNKHFLGEDHPIEATFLNKNIIETKVNTYHQYAIPRHGLADCLISFAEPKEDIIEGYYMDGKPLVGIQWHPERKSPDTSFNTALMKSFVDGKGWWKR